MSKRLQYIIIAAAVLLTAVWVGLWFKVRTDCELSERTEIVVNGETRKTLRASLSGFYPGKSESYTIVLTGAEDYDVTLEFLEGTESVLSEYITVRITTDEVRVEKELSELTEIGAIELGRQAKEIVLEYTLSESAGNEAQGASASFELEIRAKNHEE